MPGGRTIYVMALLIIVVILIAIPVYNFFQKTPTCTDNKQNGDEEGVDCGGSCSRVCEFNTEEPVVLWSRSFEVRSGVYNSMAMVENPNVSAGAFNVPYTFRLFDKESVLVYERKGKTNIPTQARFPIFEGSIVTGERVPVRTFFDFGSNIEWLKLPSNSSDLKVLDQKIINPNTSPRVEVLVENRGLNKIENFSVFTVVYDMIDNSIAGSSTFVESIPPDSQKMLVFTWPEPFSSPVGRIEILPKFSIEE